VEKEISAKGTNDPKVVAFYDAIQRLGKVKSSIAKEHEKQTSLASSNQTKTAGLICEV
jgi:hypothetical protein